MSERASLSWALTLVQVVAMPPSFQKVGDYWNWPTSSMTTSDRGRAGRSWIRTGNDVGRIGNQAYARLPGLPYNHGEFRRTN